MKRRCIFFCLIFLVASSFTSVSAQLKWKSKIFSLPFNEQIRIGYSLDNTLYKHFARDFSLTLAANGLQKLCLRDKKKQTLILGRTSIFIITAIIAFEIGQARTDPENSFIGLADIGVGIIAHITGQFISRRLFRL